MFLNYEKILRNREQAWITDTPRPQLRFSGPFAGLPRKRRVLVRRLREIKNIGGFGASQSLVFIRQTSHFWQIFAANIREVYSRIFAANIRGEHSGEYSPRIYGGIFAPNIRQRRHEPASKKSTAAPVSARRRCAVRP